MVAAVCMMVAGEAFGHGGYQCVYGPSLLQRGGDCPAHLPHIDQSAPLDRRGRQKKLLLANSKKHNPLVLVALQDNNCVFVFPYSHRYLPEVPGVFDGATRDGRAQPWGRDPISTGSGPPRRSVDRGEPSRSLVH